MSDLHAGQERPLRWMTWIAGGVACAAIFYWGARTSYPLFAYDDAFISYRYAHNLRSGLGLVYNPGEWVLGTTTPLYTLILSALGLLFSDFVALGHWLGVVSWMVCAVGMLLLFWHEGNPRAGVVGSLLIALQYLLLSSLGMETTFVVSLMILTAWAWLSKHKYVAVVLAALLLLARYDAALWLLFLSLEIWRRERRLPWREAVGVGVLTAPWFAFVYWRYGAILPNSAAAKIGQNTYMQSNEITQPFVEMFVWHITHDLSPVVTLAFVLAALCGLWMVLRHGRRYWWLVGWMGAYLAVYSSLKVFPFPWYHVPPLVALVMISSIGIGHLLGDRRRMALATIREAVSRGGEPGSAVHKGRLLAAAAGVLLVLTLGASSWLRVQYLTDVRGHPRGSDYYQAARWLAENAPQDSTVATIEIGIIGYYSNLAILDTMGLVSKDVARHLTGWSDTLVYAITSHWPDYAIVLTQTAWDGIVHQWWFDRYYRPVASFDSAGKDFGPTTIYELTAPAITPYRASAQAEYTTGLVLASVDFDRQIMRPGKSLDLWLQFEVHRRQSSDYQLTVYLVDAQTYEHKAQTTLWPYYLMSAYPASHWMDGDTRSVPVRIEIPEDLLPGTYRLGVLVYDPAQNRSLPLAADPDSDYPEVQVGYLRVGQPPDLAKAEGFSVTPVEANWEGSVALRNVGQPVEPPLAGDLLPVQLEWQATGTPERDATVFVHLVDESGKIVAQQDQRPFAGRFPLPAWEPGEVMHDVVLISLPAELPSGQYNLKIGLYDTAGRLSRSDTDDDTMSQDPVSVPIKVRGPVN